MFRVISNPEIRPVWDIIYAYVGVRSGEVFIFSPSEAFIS